MTTSLLLDVFAVGPIQANCVLLGDTAAGEVVVIDPGDEGALIAEKIAANSPTAVQAVKRAVRMGYGEPIEQAVAIMMEEHWRSAIHPDRIDGIRAFNEGREPTFHDPDY